MKFSERNIRVYLQDILFAIERIGMYTVKGREDFLSNGLVQDGVIRQFSVIGEAASRLPTALRAKNAKIPWKQIIGMRNIIVHDYSDIDLPTIWGSVEQGLPPLRKTVEAMLKDIERI